MGSRFLSSAGTERNCALPMRLPKGLNPSPAQREQRKYKKKTYIKTFRKSQGGGPGGRFWGLNSFSQQNTAHKEFEGEGVSGSRGGSFLYVYVLFRT